MLTIFKMMFHYLSVVDELASPNNTATYNWLYDNDRMQDIRTFSIRLSVCPFVL